MVDFLGIGAQKAGTSWLHRNLSHHPQIWFPIVKEVHYFDTVHLDFATEKEHIHRRASRHLERLEASSLPEPVKQRRRDYLQRLTDPAFLNTDAWYRHVFSAAPKRKKAGEITPIYCAIGSAGIRHVKSMLPDVRLIYIIRDPFDRSISSLRMWMDRTDEAQNRIIKGRLFRARGNYAEHIPLWDAAFGERILYLPFGWIKAQPGRVLRSVEEFLELDAYSGYPKLETTVHPTRKIEIEPKVAAALKREAEPQNRYLKERFGEAFFAATK
jgi:hypothetical protein